MEKIYVSIKISQNLPLSPILFLFYYALLLDNLKTIRYISVVDFIDNVTILMERKTCKENSTFFYNLYEKIYKP